MQLLVLAGSGASGLKEKPTMSSRIRQVHLLPLSQCAVAASNLPGWLLSYAGGCSDWNQEAQGRVYTGIHGKTESCEL